MIPTRVELFVFDVTLFGFFTAQQVQGKPPQIRQIFSRKTCLRAALPFPKTNIQQPIASIVSMQPQPFRNHWKGNKVRATKLAARRRKPHAGGVHSSFSTAWIRLNTCGQITSAKKKAPSTQIKFWNGSVNRIGAFPLKKNQFLLLEHHRFRFGFVRCW